MATRLADGVWWLKLSGVNAYLIEDGDDLVLCDAGLARQGGKLRSEIKGTGNAVDDLDRILVTHYDMDHVGGLSAFPAAVPIYAGGDDAAFLRGDASPPLSNHKGLLQRAMGVFVETPPQDVRPIADGESVGSFTAYHTPGHSPGHTAYISESLGVGLLGDLVRSSNGGLAASPWFISYDTGVIRESIRSLVDRAPSFEVACPGHGSPLRTDGSAALAAIVGETPE